MNASSMFPDNSYTGATDSNTRLEDSTFENNHNIFLQNVDDMDDDVSILGKYYGSATNMNDIHSFNYFQVNESFVLAPSLLATDSDLTPSVQLDYPPMMVFSSSCDAIATAASDSDSEAIERIDTKENCESIAADIEFICRKAAILQRASNILFEQNRDYHKIASYQAWVEEQQNQQENCSIDNRISIWDEAKLFLFNEENEDNVPTFRLLSSTSMSMGYSTDHGPTGHPDLRTVKATMKSLSAVQQYCEFNRTHQNLTSIGDHSGEITRTDHSRKCIDTSTVQRITSVQHEEEAASKMGVRNVILSSVAPDVLLEKKNKFEIDSWYQRLPSLGFNVEVNESRIPKIKCQKRKFIKSTKRKIRILRQSKLNDENMLTNSKQKGRRRFSGSNLPLLTSKIERYPSSSEHDYQWTLLSHAVTRRTNSECDDKITL